MTTVEAFIKKNLRAWPQVFTTGGDVLHHALCVLGNGAEWTAQGIAYVDEDTVPDWTPQQERDAFAEMAHLLEEDFIETRIATLQARVDQVDTNWDNWQITGDFYPQTEHALIMNIPDDLPQDWVEAVGLMRSIALLNGWKF